MSDMSTRPGHPSTFYRKQTSLPLSHPSSCTYLRGQPDAGCEEGCRIYNHGDPATDFYVLVEGMVRFAIGFGKPECFRRRHFASRQGVRLGSVDARRQVPHRNRHMRDACTVLAIDGDALVDLMEQDNALGFQLMKRLNLLVTGTLTAFAAA